MVKKVSSSAFFIIFTFIFSFSLFSQSPQNTLTITTYYPSPFGVYKELRVKRMAIGDNYYKSSDYCWEGICSTHISSNTGLIVEGNVGIGTDNPQVKLHVNGRIKAQDPIDDDDVTTKKYVDAQVGASIPIVRFTEALYKGNLGGVAGADAKCQAEFGPSFHFCDCCKALGAMPGVSAIRGGWCRWDGAFNNCDNWTRSFYLSVTDVGQIIYQTSGFWQCGAGASISQSHCDSSNRLVCCNW